MSICAAVPLEDDKRQSSVSPADIYFALVFVFAGINTTCLPLLYPSVCEQSKVSSQGLLVRKQDKTKSISDILFHHQDVHPAGSFRPCTKVSKQKLQRRTWLMRLFCLKYKFIAPLLLALFLKVSNIFSLHIVVYGQVIFVISTKLGSSRHQHFLDTVSTVETAFLNFSLIQDFC